MLMLPVLLWGCSGVLSNVLPAGAVLSPTEADAFEAPALPSVRYTGAPPRLPGPLPPLQVFGVYYAVDIVIVSDHPDWNMHEYARLDAPQGSVWLAKDSTHDGVQTITADLPDIETWVADVPVPRRAGPVAVQEDWDGDHLTLSLDYTNPHDQAVSVQVEARVPSRPPRLRNGNTMGHSRQAVAAVLDLERMGDAKAEISIDGEARKVVRLLGLAPMEFVLQQAQAGFAIADFAAQPTDGGLRITRPGQDAAWPSRAEEVWERQDGPDGLTRLVYDDGYLIRTYAFLDGGLLWAEVAQHGRDVPVLRAWLSPALPDVTRPFVGEAESRFRLDVNGQVGHGTGIVRARWSEDQQAVILELEPLSPRWLADRPMVGHVRYPLGGGAAVRMRRAEP